jgi:16S rRNA (cytidine1402-2'-O)-methyltransferase
LASLPNTFVLYESPHRLAKCLQQLIEHCGGERQACVAREISKYYEDIRTTTLSALHEHYQQEGAAKGEIVIIVGGKAD